MNDEYPQAFMITWNMYGRRFLNKSNYKKPVSKILDITLNNEITIAKIIGMISIENQIPIVGFNICNDHAHVIIVVKNSKLKNTVRLLKGKSSQKFKESKNVDSVVKFRLWGKSFHYLRLGTYRKYYNAMNYVRFNRGKHGLAYSQELEYVIDSFTLSEEEAFSIAEKS